MSTFLERHRSGDAAAAGELVDRYGPAAYLIALAILEDAPRTEAAVAEALDETLRHASHFDAGIDDEARWVLAVVRRHALFSLREGGKRRRGRRRERDDDELEAGVTASMPPDLTPEAVGRAFRALRPAQREALSLSYVTGMDASEVGRRVGVPEVMARNRLRSGLVDLTDQLSPGAGGEW